jgi:hypothetical protein
VPLFGRLANAHVLLEGDAQAIKLNFPFLLAGFSVAHGSKCDVEVEVWMAYREQRGHSFMFLFRLPLAMTAVSRSER